MDFRSNMEFDCSLSTTIIRANGRQEPGFGPQNRRKVMRSPLAYWRALFDRFRREIPWLCGLSFAAFVEWMTHEPQNGMAVQIGFQQAGLGLKDFLIAGGCLPFGIVTTAGINYLMTLFVSSTNPLINFKYHDIGTGKLLGSTNGLTSPYATNATPIVITETSHGRLTGDLVRIQGVTGNTNANGDWEILWLSANTYSLYGSVGNAGAGGSPTAQSISGASDTALSAAAGTARVAGSQSNPSSNQYQTVATITNATSGALVISEWGLFSASSAGTLWDRRWFNNGGGGNAAPQTTATATLSALTNGLAIGDSLQSTYTVTGTAGGGSAFAGY